MAGAGARFVQAGYQVPKPMIPVEGVPMVVRAAQSLPDADLWIFVARREHLQKYPIEKELKKIFCKCRIISLETPTEGQASTCLLAENETRTDDFLTIGTCDNALRFSPVLYQSLVKQEINEFLVWTFRFHSCVIQDPRMYGWVKTGPSGKIEYVSVKKPISKNPISDHAVSGTFTFRRAELFFESVKAMIKNNSRINGEFYIDEAVNFALKQAATGAVFQVDQYIGWGTPQDLEKYRKAQERAAE